MTGAVTIFEGPDGAGKTTIASAYAAAFSEPLIHVGPPSRNPLMDLLRLLDDNADDVTFDRFHIGEQVYGPIYRRGDALGSFGRKLLERKRLMPRRAVVVLCMPPFSVARANWAARKATGGEMFPEGYDKVWDRFVVCESQLPRLMFDYTTDTDNAAVFANIERLRHDNYGGIRCSI